MNRNQLVKFRRSPKTTIDYAIYIGFFLLLSTCLDASIKDNTMNLQIPQNVWLEYAEKALVVNWDTVAGAIGYNVYRSSVEKAEKENMEKINHKLITSGPRFVFIWRINEGKREKTIKGYHHYISVTAVFEINGDTCESALSKEVSNNYFDGFAKMTSKKQIKKILLAKQQSSNLPIDYKSNDRDTFIAFMTGPGRYLTEILEYSFNFQEVGACDPISTIAVHLLQHWGLDALKAEGIFIEKYHTFIIIKVEDVDYVIDFTADQFVPGVSPVIVPRDLCYINKNGNLDTTGTAIYQIGRISPPGSSQLTDTQKSRIYHHIYREVLNKYFNPH